MEKVSALMLVNIKKVEQETVVVYTEEDGTQRQESRPHVHYETPVVPGMQSKVLASNPASPNEQQLWLVTAGRPVIVALSGEPDFEWLTVEKAEKYLGDWGSPLRLKEIVESYIPPVIEPVEG